MLSSTKYLVLQVLHSFVSPSTHSLQLSTLQFNDSVHSFLSSEISNPSLQSVHFELDEHLSQFFIKMVHDSHCP